MAAPSPNAIGDYTNGPPERDFLFLNDAPAELSHTTTTSAADEPGERFRITGRLLMPGGDAPAAGCLMYVYHTNASGLYAGGEREPKWSYRRWHGRLHGFLRTNERGEYAIEGVRPAPYPDGTEPAHIHCAVKSADGTRSFWISDFVFEGDPFLDEEYWKGTERWGFVRYGGVRLEKDAEGTWVGSRDIEIPPF